VSIIHDIILSSGQIPPGGTTIEIPIRKLPHHSYKQTIIDLDKKRKNEEQITS
jgi:hypothetical protein